MGNCCGSSGSKHSERGQTNSGQTRRRIQYAQKTNEEINAISVDQTPKERKQSVKEIEVRVDFETLLKKLNSEITIDSSVRKQIKKALENYGEKINNVNNIQKAKAILEGLETEDYAVINSKDTLDDIRNRLHQKNLDPNEYETCLKNLTSWYTSSKEAGQSKQDQTSLLFLELYSKCPTQSDRMFYLKSAVEYMNKCSEKLHKFNDEGLDQSKIAEKLEELKSKLEEVNKYLQTLNTNISGTKNVASAPLPPNSSLENIIEDAPQPSGSTEEVCETSQENYITSLMIDNEISKTSETEESNRDLAQYITTSAVNSIKNIKDENDVKLLSPSARQEDVKEPLQVQEDINLRQTQVEENRKHYASLPPPATKNHVSVVRHPSQDSFLSTTIQVQDKLIDENKKLLEVIETEVNALAESHKQFEEKKICLEELKNKISTINALGEIAPLKSTISSRINGLLMIEIANYLKKVKKEIKKCEISEDWKQSKTQLSSLKESVKRIPTPNGFVEKELKFLIQNIDDVEKFLDVKSNKHGKIVLELETIKNNIVTKDNDSSMKLENRLRLFNDCRKQVNDVVIVDKSTSEMKTKIFSLLHQHEDRALSSCRESVKTFKKTLNTYENDIHGLVDPITKDLYQQKKNKIESHWESSKTKIQSFEFYKMLEENVNLLTNFIDEFWTYSEEIINRIEKLDNIEKNIDESTGSIVTPMQEEIIEQMKQSSTNPAIISNKIETIEKKIYIKKAKREINSLKQKLIELKQDIKNGKYKINEIFSIKIGLDNLPEGDSSLYKQKQNFLEELCGVIENVDKYLARALGGQKQTTKILELGDQFDFKPESIQVPTNSVEFVELILKRAQTFEERANNYTGTNYSVDYYVINENLVRLLEELDKVNCKGNDLLLQELIKAMDYIKKLLEKLDSNVTS